MSAAAEVRVVSRGAADRGAEGMTAVISLDMSRDCTGSPTTDSSGAHERRLSCGASGSDRRTKGVRDAAHLGD